MPAEAPKRPRKLLLAVAAMSTALPISAGGCANNPGTSLEAGYDAQDGEASVQVHGLVANEAGYDAVGRVAPDAGYDGGSGEQ